MRTREGHGASGMIRRVTARGVAALADPLGDRPSNVVPLAEPAKRGLKAGMSGFTLQLHRPPIDHPHGLHGAFDSALYAIAQDGVTLDRDAAMVASGLAFRTYQFRASDNWAWLDSHPGAHWRWASLMVENYGAFEALAAHSKRDLCWYNDLKPVEWLGLVTYELEAGRTPVVQTPEAGGRVRDDDRRPSAVWALHAAAREEKSWSNAAAGGSHDNAISITYPALDVHPADGELRVAGMLVARPAAEETPDARLPALWRDALSFAVRHAQGPRELEFGQELYYASGAEAWRATIELLEQHADDEELLTYW
ncbi:MAG: hypothetical protein ACJA1R_002383, partial [Flavobacteriales bacterium]